MTLSRFALLLVLCFSAAGARADVLVLVHGWSANADTWIQSGVLPVLAASGWRDGGVLTPAGVVAAPPLAPAGDKTVYRAQLAAEAPLLVQAQQLAAELAQVRRLHPQERLTVAGHSAGGVVARLVLVHPDAPRIDALVTIAAPNLGTERAIQGLEVADSRPFFCPGPGFDLLKEFVGGEGYRYLEYSRPALADLTPAVPGSLIGWLNQQPHPDIAYDAVIRTGAPYGDELVPAVSQDLGRVPALHGKVRTWLTPTGHALNPADGQLLLRIVAQ